MFDYSAEIIKSSTVNDAAIKVAMHVKDTLECELCNMYQVDLARGELVCLASTGDATNVRIGRFLFLSVFGM